MADLSRPADRMKALAKMRGALDGRLTPWWLKGVLYAVVDQEPMKLWAMEVVSFNRWREIEPGTFMFSHYELSVKIDPGTGDPIDHFFNPYTDEDVSVGNDILGPSTLIVTAESARLPMDLGPKAPRLAHHVGDAAVLDDRVWIGQELFATVEPPVEGAAPWKARDISTYSGSLSAVLDDTIASVAAETVYQGFYDWRPWMKMGDTKGFLLARLAGAKLASMDDIPESYRKIADEIEPDFLSSADEKTQLPG